MPTTKQATQFVAPNGKVIVYLTTFPRDGEVLFSPDGVTFYALAIRGFSGTAFEHLLSFDDPHQGVSGKLCRDGDVIGYDSVWYTQQDVTFDQSSVVPLPATRRIEYLCQAEDGTLFYFSADEYNHSYESFKLYVGDGVTMLEIPVLHVARSRDGGTTYVNTLEGIFFMPSPFSAQRDPNIVPMWGLQKLTSLDKDSYDIVETPEGEVSITKR